VILVVNRSRIIKLLNKMYHAKLLILYRSHYVFLVAILVYYVGINDKDKKMAHAKL